MARRIHPSHATVRDALEEARHAVKKHGAPTCDPIRAIAILTEELGEASEEALKLTSSDPNEHGEIPIGERKRMLYNELAQIAGHALLQMQNINAGRLLPNHPSQRKIEDR
jgi:hypothetical protein